MKRVFNTLWESIAQHGFIVLLSLAAISHSAWSINSVFGGTEPLPMYSGDWWGWYLPGLLMSITIDVGLLAFVTRLQNGERQVSLIVGYLLLCALMAFGQFVYVASHIANFALASGVADYYHDLANGIIKAALFVYPAALPVVSAVYAFSVRQKPAAESLTMVDVPANAVTVNFVRPEPHPDPSLPSGDMPALPEQSVVNSEESETPILVDVPLTVPASAPSGEHSIPMPRQLRTSDKHCAHCGEPLPESSRRTYCSDSCKQLAYVARKSAVQQEG